MATWLSIWKASVSVDDNGVGIAGLGVDRGKGGAAGARALAQ